MLDKNFNCDGLRANKIEFDELTLQELSFISVIMDSITRNGFEIPIEFKKYGYYVCWDFKK